MPYDVRSVGQVTDSISHDVDARWLMAYAAGLGDANPAYLDTAAGDIIGHPLFPVCLEWPSNLALRHLQYADALTQEEAARGVHATHDLQIFRPIVPGGRYTTRAKIVAIRTIKPGAAQLIRLDTTDESGELICTTWQTGIARGVEVVGIEQVLEEPPPPPSAEAAELSDRRFEVAVSQGLGNVYTETARIYNPIHSDRAYALAAGLPDIILHGTATLALGVSEIVNGMLDGDAFLVRRIGGRFTGMVLMPNQLSVEVTAQTGKTIFFVIRRSDGQVVFDQGFLSFDG